MCWLSLSSCGPLVEFGLKSDMSSSSISSAGISQHSLLLCCFVALGMLFNCNLHKKHVSSASQAG